jgi:transposase
VIVHSRSIFAHFLLQAGRWKKYEFTRPPRSAPAEPLATWCVTVPSRCSFRCSLQFDKLQYKHRNLIERFFLRIKHFRRIATRYDKLAERFSSFIVIVAFFLWLI